MKKTVKTTKVTTEAKVTTTKTEKLHTVVGGVSYVTGATAANALQIAIQPLRLARWINNKTYSFKNKTYVSTKAVAKEKAIKGYDDMNGYWEAGYTAIDAEIDAMIAKSKAKRLAKEKEAEKNTAK